MTQNSGSAKPGPSKAYIRLLEGKITSRKYSQTVKKSVGKSLSTPYRIKGSDKPSSA